MAEVHAIGGQTLAAQANESCHVSVFDRWRSPRVVAWLAFFGAVLALVLAWSFGDSPPAWYPACVFHAATDLHCPGCGAARAVHAALHGEWGTALDSNALLFMFAPFVAAWAAQAWWRGVRRNQSPASLPVGLASLTLWLVLAFGIARNLPWQPFAWLAPGP